MRSVCVYCGSNLGADPAFAEATRALGAFLDHAVRSGFLRSAQRAVLRMEADPERLVDGLQLA